jgi:hypothetical protein
MKVIDGWSEKVYEVHRSALDSLFSPAVKTK